MGNTPRLEGLTRGGVTLKSLGVVTWAWWLVFEEPGCGGWFLLNEGALAGF